MFTKLDFPNLIAGTLLGAVIGWVISAYYYQKSLDDAKVSALERERVDQLLLKGIESVGTIKYARDANGNIRGVSIELRADATASTSGSASLSVTNGSAQ